MSTERRAQIVIFLFIFIALLLAIAVSKAKAAPAAPEESCVKNVIYDPPAFFEIRKKQVSAYIETTNKCGYSIRVHYGGINPLTVTPSICVKLSDERNVLVCKMKNNARKFTINFEVTGEYGSYAYFDLFNQENEYLWQSNRGQILPPKIYFPHVFNVNQ